MVSVRYRNRNLEFLSNVVLNPQSVTGAILGVLLSVVSLKKSKVVKYIHFLFDKRLFLKS